MMRAIARIDGDDKARRVGNRYSQTNRSRVQAELEAKAAQGLVPQDPHALHLARKAQAANYKSISERAIPVPRVGVVTSGARLPPVAFIPHRPTRDEIAAANGGFERPLAPPGKPTKSSDERKDELAMRNQFYGRTPEEVLAQAASSSAAAAVPRRRPNKAPAKADETELRNKIADEIAEARQSHRASTLDNCRARIPQLHGLLLVQLLCSLPPCLQRQSWLDKMRELGQSDAYEHQMKVEIAERLKELEKLDRLVNW